MGCFVHRFLISSPNLRIDASFSPFTPSCVHRFLISSPDLGIDAKYFPENNLLRASILDFMGSIWESLQRIPSFWPRCCSNSGFQGVNLRIAARVVAGTEEWPACSTIVVAIKNGPPATAVAAAICRLRFYLRLTQRNS